ncbi:ABC transporter ATP-binding protein YtrE [Muribaculaceae bacterium]|nr:ABC transporter ATP-binding protein YtrE [Muribaculaceae bacterium]
MNMAEAERTDFIRAIRSQTDKLDFLFQALVKTSRLETGVIRLDKKPERLFDTVAQAMSGIVYAAEKKKITVSADCPEDLTVSHDSKRTSEPLFNLSDNAVKYTPAGGKIAVSVVLWEMYVEIKAADTGKGISESKQASIFRRNIGFIFQNYNLVPILNVYENIVLPVELDGNTVDQKFLDEIVHLPGLEDKLKNMPNNLSGGQQQRVAIARALITKPAIVLADEPTGNLDSKTSAEVLGLIKRTSAEFRQTVVMITHNNDIARLADRIVRIEDGKIVE